LSRRDIHQTSNTDFNSTLSHSNQYITRHQQPATMLSATVLLSLLSLLPSAISSPTPIQARACVGPPINAATIALIKEFEGFVPSPAPDPIGLPTVGYGHLCKTAGCAEVPYPFPLSEESASKLLLEDAVVRLIPSLPTPPSMNLRVAFNIS